MLIAVFLGAFGAFMALLTAIRVILEGRQERRIAGEKARVQVKPPNVQGCTKVASDASPSVKQAFSDLWKEILKGA